MNMLLRLIVLFWLVSFGFLFSAPAYAECGGQQQCIAVSINPLVAPAHGTPLTSAPIAFGSLAAGATSAARTILVAAVTGPVGTQATLDAITLGGANPSDFTITGGTTCTTGTPSLLHDGQIQAQLANTCKIMVTFNPATTGAKSATISVQTTSITRVIPLTGAGGIPDPSTDANVVSLISSQFQTARRFSQAQISNIQQRMERLRHAAPSDNTRAQNLDNSAPGNNFKPIFLAYQNNPSQTTGQTPRTSSGASTDSSSELASILASAVNTSSVNLATLAGGGGSTPSAEPGGLQIWGAGTLRFGTRNQVMGNLTNFTTDGVSLGVDRRFSERLTLGMGMGYARDHSTIGIDGTDSMSNGRSFAFYSSFQATPTMFIDGLIGYGTLNLDTNRYVSSVDDFARAQRDGNQVFGSLAMGYEYRSDGLLLSPYGRLDVAKDKLNAATESGTASYAINYASQSSRNSQLALGVRSETSHQTSFGQSLPHARIEYQRSIENSGQAAMVLNGITYTYAPAKANTNSLVLGLGSDFMFRGGLKLGVDYQTLLSNSHEKNQAINFTMSQELGGKGAPISYSLPTFTKPLGILVEGGMTYDDNVSRTNVASDKLHDSSFSVNLSKGLIIPITKHTRMTLSGSLGSEQFRTYTGLGRVSVGAQSEWMYRSSGEFGAPTWALFGRAFADQYESTLRDGSRYAAGLSVRKPLTDRISLFGAWSRNVRNGKNDVFDTRDHALRMNLDYALTAKSTIYVSGESRRGDIVSSGKSSPGLSSIAKASTQDDVFTNPQYYAYRLQAKTVLTTLGYNLSFGPHDSLDFSWRRVQSTPTQQVNYYGAGGSPSYTANQFGVAYLMSF